MKTDDTSLHGSYFDLLQSKYPDLDPPASPRPTRLPRLRRGRRSVAPMVLVVLLVVGVFALAVALRPEAEAPAAAAREFPQPAASLAPPEEPPAEPSPAAKSPVADVAAARVDPLPSPVAEKIAEAPRRRAAEPGPVRSAQPGSARPDVERRTAPSRAAEPAVVSFQPARKLSSTPPAYPEAARLAGEEGKVVVEAQVDATGAVTGTDVVRGRSPALDRAAAEALAAWRFEPAVRGGVPVESTYRVSFTFALEPPASGPSRQARAPSTPLEVGGDVEPPRRLAAPLPEYPDEAWAAGVTGDVLVRAVIDERGKVADVEVLKGLPHGMTEAALAAIRRWKFAPATRHGQPVAVYRNLSVRFET